MVKLFDAEKVKCVIDEKIYGFDIDSGRTTCDIEKKGHDFDRYYFETRSKEMIVKVDFIENKISGDMFAYGEYGEMELSECIKVLKTLESKDIIRDFSNLINQYEQSLKQGTKRGEEKGLY
ncbi:hypothetical protein [Lysinibacillus sphaericus]|uniref:hypothetical protein n=1 Tax=Lysinibacillus sphaericus TaxID=1421 RepID=UPI0018CE9284|nr:hypothetical protein [Lysinibacillus sphaericus]